jgi:hypothetical protein
LGGAGGVVGRVAGGGTSDRVVSSVEGALFIDDDGRRSGVEPTFDGWLTMLWPFPLFVVGLPVDRVGSTEGAVSQGSDGIEVVTRLSSSRNDVGTIDDRT